MRYPCPKCQKIVGIDGTGKYKCPYCNNSFSVTEDSFQKSLKKEMYTPVKKKTFSIIYLWILSIITIFFSFFFFGPSFFAGLLILFSGLFILPPIRKIYSKKFNIRLRYILIIFLILFFTGIILTPKEYNTPGVVAGMTQKILPEDTNSTTDNPVFRIAYNCINVRKILINQTELTQNEINKLCNQQYNIKLKPGENIYSIIIISRNSKIEETLKVIFDEKAYETKLADEQAKARAAAEARRKAEAEAKAAAEAAAKAKATAELNTYATKYCTNRKTNTRKFGKLTLSGSKISAKFSEGTTGKYLTTTKCKEIVSFVINLMKYRNGSVDYDILNLIVKGNYQMGMDKYYFFASVGNPNDINTSQYGNSYTNDQVIYYKDSYGISAQYFYFDNDVLTSYQDF